MEEIIKTEDQSQDQNYKPLFDEEEGFTETELSGVDDEKANRKMAFLYAAFFCVD